MFFILTGTVSNEAGVSLNLGDSGAALPPTNDTGAIVNSVVSFSK